MRTIGNRFLGKGNLQTLSGSFSSFYRTASETEQLDSPRFVNSKSCKLIDFPHLFFEGEFPRNFFSVL